MGQISIGYPQPHTIKLPVSKFNYLPWNLTGAIFLYAHPQVIYNKWVKFHQYWFTRYGVVAHIMDRQTDRQTDRHGVSNYYPQTLIEGGW